MQATPAQIAAAEKEGAARLASCTTAECRQVIEALNTKKLAKLKGARRSCRVRYAANHLGTRCPCAPDLTPAGPARRPAALRR